jgi:hypothetical protein
MTRLIWSLSAFGLLLGGIVIGHSVRPVAAAEPCMIEKEPTPPVTDPQFWLWRGIDACESRCGAAVPFDVEVEPQRVRCNCGRPPKLAVTKIR